MKQVFHPAAGRVASLLSLAVLLILGGAPVLAGDLPDALRASGAQPPGTVLNPDNGHYYALVVSEWISWPEAHQQALLTDLNDCQGYLATVTSAAENAFLVDNFGEELVTSGFGFWLGGYQDPGVVPPDYGWQWVTGEPWSYTNWNTGEPNDFHGPASEQHLDMVAASEFEVGLWNDEMLASNVRGYIVECDPARGQVEIDIKPGSWPNSINLTSAGLVPVALLTTGDFDAGAAAPAAVRFAGAAPVRWRPEDADADGDLDLVFHFRTQDLGLDRNATEATMEGLTSAGVGFHGTDSVRIVPRSR